MPCRLPPETTGSRPPATPRRRPPRPHSSVPPQSPPRTGAAPHAAQPRVGLASAVWLVRPAPNAASVSSSQPLPVRCCDDRLNSPKICRFATRSGWPRPESSCRSGAPGIRTTALAETVIGLFKTEEAHRRGPWKGLEDVEFATSSGSHRTTGAACWNRSATSRRPSSSRPIMTVRRLQPAWRFSRNELPGEPGAVHPIPLRLYQDPQAIAARGILRRYCSSTMSTLRVHSWRSATLRWFQITASASTSAGPVCKLLRPRSMTVSGYRSKPASQGLMSKP